MKYLYFILVLSSISLPALLQARQDTLFVCKSLDLIRLETDTAFSAYRWSPAASLDNPTIFNPWARPTATTTYVVEKIKRQSGGNNLIFNSDFTTGNTGFTTGYRYSPNVINTQGVYAITTNPAQLNPSAFAACGDHTNGKGQMLMVDGFPQANVKVWCQKSDINPNPRSAFSPWIPSANPANPAILQFSINNRNLGTPFVASRNVCEWRQFFETWESKNAVSAEICIVNQNTNPNGNDFALDDFAFVPVEAVSYDTVTVIVLSNTVTTIDTAICTNARLLYNGISYAAGSQNNIRLTSSLGCDSLINLRIGIRDTVFSSSRVDTLCPGEVLTFGIHIIRRDTQFCEPSIRAGACDSPFCLTVVFLTASAIALDAVPPSCSDSFDGSILSMVTAGKPPFQYLWSTDAAQPQISNLPAGRFSLTVTDVKGCRAVRAVELTAPPGLTLEAGGAAKWCDGKATAAIQLSANGGTPPYAYSFDGGRQFTAAASGNKLLPGVFKLVVQDANGCTKDSTLTIETPEEPLLTPPPDTSVLLGQVLQAALRTNVKLLLQYQWEPPEGLDCPTCAEVAVRPLQNTRYEITATDPEGCRLRAFWQVQVEKQYPVFIPNAFSPNGDDLNDQLEIFPGATLEQVLEWQIFERWGNLVFATENSSAGRWDGTSQGLPLDPGVYAYTVKLRFIDGVEAVMSGMVTLLR